MAVAHLLLVATAADVYMQYPPGSNNRLAEGGGNRNNNNRLMDTQNNAKGGYGYGGSANNKADPVSYFAGSKISLAWTSQHSCGSENAECQIVWQYMCSDSSQTAPPGVTVTPQTGVGEGPIRDGTDGNTPDPNNADANRGLHEPTSFYTACDNRERNKGLYTADQNLNGNDARRTRQNPNGARSGLECPEERDYYPYWAPTPWKDLVVMTNNLRLCDFYKENSQNVKERGYCTGNNGNQVPNNPEGCAAAQGQWTIVPAFGLPPPECVAAPYQRDNHLGSGPTGQEVMVNISVPFSAGGLGVDSAENCVMRMRYNITTADTRVCSIKTITTQAACEAAIDPATGAPGIWSALYLDASYNDQVQNLNNNNPLPAGQTLVPGNPRVDLGGALTNGGGADSLLELAINTNQYGRTFQDRTHVFSIRPRPAAIGNNVNIVNLNVKGKRGNIVQTYPATEYDFHPTDAVVGATDLVHFQWTGNDNTNNNGNNNGEGTNNEDRHNIVQVSAAGMDVPLPASEANMFDVDFEWNPEAATSQFGGVRDQLQLTKQFALVKQTGCGAGNQNNDQNRQNCEKLNSASATMDLGLLRFKPGNFTYMSSRNNNFSNRAQKATLKVLTTGTAPLAPPVNVQAVPVQSDNADIARMRLTWAPPGSKTGYMGTDGKEYWGAEQVAAAPAAYRVQYTIDGGESWAAVEGCQTTATSCDVDFLPPGTPVGFRVHSGNEAGWGEPSELALVQTTPSSTSQACQQQLLDQMEGNYLTPAAVVAIVLGVIAGVAGLLFLIFMVRRRQPPPPPPPGMMKDVAPSGGYA